MSTIDRCMARWGSKNKYRKDTCSKKTRLHLQPLYIFHSQQQTQLGTIYNLLCTQLRRQQTCTPNSLNWLVRDDHELLADGGEIPISQGRSWRFDSQLWHLLSTWHNIANQSTASCASALACCRYVSKRRRRKRRQKPSLAKFHSDFLFFFIELFIVDLLMHDTESWCTESYQPNLECMKNEPKYTPPPHIYLTSYLPLKYLT